MRGAYTLRDGWEAGEDYRLHDARKYSSIAHQDAWKRSSSYVR
jgi:hypothetical protein